MEAFEDQERRVKQVFMGGGILIFIVILGLIVVVLVMRWVGAWMLRIDEVIDLLKEGNAQRKKIIEQNEEIKRLAKLNTSVENMLGMVRPSETPKKS